MPVPVRGQQDHTGLNFAAGTLVVCDVDPQAQTISSYRPDTLPEPVVFQLEDSANAEPALPGWVVEVLG